MAEIIQGLVSTVIPVRNRPHLLREAVASVLAQTHRPIEVIICDDGSTDETPRVAMALAADHSDEVRVLLNENRGPGPAREAGRLAARGEFIQYLDSDDRLLPRKFEVQIAALRERPECGVAYGWARLLVEGTHPGRVPFKWTGRALPTLFPRLLIDRWWTTECPLYRRSVCDAVGPWSDLRYSQDWEYDGRVGALGTRLVHCPEFVCEHRHHAGARQTGHGRWLSPKERVRFFTLLHGYALRASVNPKGPEMRHFARWVFRNARLCGAMGDAEAAAACFRLAREAAGGAAGDLCAYRFLAGILGWRLAGRLASLRDRFRPDSAGRDTLRLSWMKP